MLCWIAILGGLLIMMGQHARSEALFYYFRLEDQVPENHLLRLIEKHISLAFVRGEVSRRDIRRRPEAGVSARSKTGWAGRGPTQAGWNARVSSRESRDAVFVLPDWP